MDAWMQHGYRETTMQADVPSRAQFITKTYLHLLGAVMVLIAIEVVLFQTGAVATIAGALAGGRAFWLAILGGFAIVNWLASHVARTSMSRPAQYAALGTYIVAEALILALPLFVATKFYPGVLLPAALVTAIGFTALTAIVFVTREDFTFLRSILMWGGLIAFGAIVCSLIFGFQLGIFFTVAMIGFAGAAILYDTSNVLHHYSEDRYVAASLQLFASVVLLFWYVLRLFMQRD